MITDLTIINEEVVRTKVGEIFACNPHLRNEDGTYTQGNRHECTLEAYRQLIAALGVKIQVMQEKLDRYGIR